MAPKPISSLDQIDGLNFSGWDNKIVGSNFLGKRLSFPEDLLPQKQSLGLSVGPKLERCQSSDILQQQTQAAQVQPCSSRYKTELCRPFQETGHCKYDQKCQFAHGMQELRNLTRHPKYKTEPCRTFHTTGLCGYGSRCHFIHEDSSSTNTGNSQTSPSGSQRRPIPDLKAPPPLLSQHQQFVQIPLSPPISSYGGSMSPPDFGGNLSPPDSIKGAHSPPGSINGSPTSPGGKFFDETNLSCLTNQDNFDKYRYHVNLSCLLTPPSNSPPHSKSPPLLHLEDFMSNLNISPPPTGNNTGYSFNTGALANFGAWNNNSNRVINF